MQGTGTTVRVLLAIIATILIVSALKATSAVTMPLAFAVFLAILVHPMHCWLNRRLPRAVSLTIVMLVLAAVLGLAIAALGLSVELVEPKVPEYSDRLQQMIQTSVSWLQEQGIPIQEQPLRSQDTLRRFSDEAIAWTKMVSGALSLFVLIVALLVLLLLEVREYRTKAERAFPQQIGRKVIDAFERLGDKFRSYLKVRTLTSGLTGILTALWCWIIGVELAFVWGLISFILNYIPTLGSIVAIIPPTLFALLFLGIGRGVATLVGLTAIQLALGNFVDPRMQGNSLSISPFVVLVSIVFWGWVWGIPGALIGVPMTVAFVMFCSEFDSLNAIAVLLGEPDDDSDDGE